MQMKPRDAQKLRETFAGWSGRALPDVSVTGDDLEIVLCPQNNSTGVIIPYNEAGDSIFLELENVTLKRWRTECKEANRLMRRVAAGEKNTAYNEHRASGQTGTRV